MGSKSSRSIEHINEPLSEKLIEELSRETGFTDEEIFDLHTFVKENFVLTRSLRISFLLEISIEIVQMEN